MQMFGEAWGGKKKEEADGLIIGGIPGNAPVVTAENDDGPPKNTAHCIAPVWESEAFANGGGVQFLPVGEGLPKGYLFGGPITEVGNEADEFAKKIVAVVALEAKV